MTFNGKANAFLHLNERETETDTEIGNLSGHVVERLLVNYQNLKR